MKKVKFVFVLLIIFLEPAFSQDSLNIRGDWWKEIGMVKQVPFLTGFYDGISFGAGLALNGLDPNSICTNIGAASLNRIQILDSLQVMYVQDEISNLYKDTANKCIFIQHAFWIAANQLAKSDSGYIRRLFEIYRKEDCRKSERMK
jgi:hypothetical protein